MQMPALLPEQLQGYAGSQSEDELFDALLKRPIDLVEFFDYACDDESWTLKYPDFMRKTLAWITKQSFQDKLSGDDLKKAAKSIRSHYSNLHGRMPHNLIFKLSDTSIQANSALYSAACPFFHDLIRRECFDKKQFKLEFLEIPYTQIFRFVEEYVTTGAVSNLWRMEKDEVMRVLKYASSIQLTGLSELCEEVLSKYLTEKNVYAMLLMAQAESLHKLKEACFEFINSKELGFTLELAGPDTIACKFHKFSEKAMEAFDHFRQGITHLIFPEETSNDPNFPVVVRGCPALMSIDLSHTLYYTEYLPSVPSSLHELNISSCEWLSTHYLKKIVELLPGLRSLRLASNVQLTAHAWGELMHMQALSTLDIARCPQIRDDDFRIILHACAGVSELNVEECRLVSERSFHDLARSCTKLQRLCLARTYVTDAALIDISSRCRGLTHLDLTRCDRITDKGVIETIKNGFNLLEVNLSNCHVSPTMIEEMRRQKPFLRIITTA